MMAAGDMMQQRSDFLKKHLSEAKNASKVYAAEDVGLDDDFQVVSKDSENFDHVRTRNMTVVGLLQGPFHHYFYQILERYIPGRSTSSIFKKTLLDQTIASPTCLGIFFFGLGALERKNLDDINGEVRLKLFDTWKVCSFNWILNTFYKNQSFRKLKDYEPNLYYFVHNISDKRFIYWFIFFAIFLDRWIACFGLPRNL